MLTRRRISAAVLGSVPTRIISLLRRSQLQPSHRLRPGLGPLIMARRREAARYLRLGPVTRSEPSVNHPGPCRCRRGRGRGRDPASASRSPPARQRLGCRDSRQAPGHGHGPGRHCIQVTCLTPSRILRVGQQCESLPLSAPTAASDSPAEAPGLASGQCTSCAVHCRCTAALLLQA